MTFINVLTFSPLTSEVTNTDHLFIKVFVSGRDILTHKWTCYSNFSLELMLEAEKWSRIRQRLNYGGWTRVKSSPNLVGCSCSAVVDVWQTESRLYADNKVADVHGERRVRLLKKWMLVWIERCQNRSFIVCCCLWGSNEEPN